MMQSHPDLGDIPTHWEIAELGDVADVTKLAGYEFTKHIKYIEDGEIIALRSLNVVDGQLDLSNVKRIARSVSEVLPRSKLFQNDLLLTYTGSKLGDTALIDQNDTYHLAPNVCRLRANEDGDAYFLYVYLRSKVFANLLDSFKVGSGQPTVPMKNIRKIPIPWPPKEERKYIGDIFSGLTDKIELNTQTNQTLEQFAQAIFKSWFVDFDPVKAKIEALAAGGSADDAELAAMGVISAKTLDELHGLKANNSEAFNTLAQTAALFPAAMQDSELGEIPEGWIVSPLSELINITGGGTPKRSEESYWNGDIPWFSVKDVPSEGNVFVVDTDEKITELGLNKSSTKLLPKGTTIITARGTVGKLALVGTDMCMNQSCYGIRGKNVGDFYNYFNLKEAVSTLQRNTHGAVFDTITTQTFDTYSLAFSGADLANKFNALVAPLLQNIETNVRQNIELATLRDTLLPKLLSGEINVTSEVVE